MDLFNTEVSTEEIDAKKDNEKVWEALNSQLLQNVFLRQFYAVDRDVDEVAKETGCEVVYPASNQLQIDIDSDEQYNYFRGRLDDFRGMVEVKDISEKPSKSGLPNRHITVTLYKEITDAERILLQFMLGSDIFRETLNTLRLLQGITPNVLFFEPKE